MAKTGSVKSPLIRIAKRSDMPRWKGWIIRLIAVLLALVVDGLIIFAIVKLNPVAVYKTMFAGAFGTTRRSWASIREAVLLLSIGIGLAPAFKMKFWNLGAEGQILLGGIATAGCMICFGGKIPNWLLILVMALVSIAAGAIWGLIPAIAKARWDTNESLFTLMLNYVAIQLTSYAVARWENPYGSNSVGIINQNSMDGWFPRLFGQTYGLNVLLAIILMVAIMPFTKLVVGTKIGVKGAIVPLVVSAAPFIARMVETSLAEVDAGVVEAAQSMGASTCQIIRKVYLPEAKPSLVLGGAISIVTILGYTAIAGTVGAGGLGDIAVRYGHQRFITSVMWVTVVILIIMVQIVQSLFGWLSKKIDKRLDTGAGKLTAFDLLSRLAHTK